MEQKEHLIKAMVSMIGFYQKRDEKSCYREFFALEMDERRLVEETFRQARNSYPTRAQRKDAKGIYKLIRKNLEKEATVITDRMRVILERWFFGTKESFCEHWKALGVWEQEAILDALDEVIAESDDDEFRQAAIDIPFYLELQKSLLLKV